MGYYRSILLIIFLFSGFSAFCPPEPARAMGSRVPRITAGFSALTVLDEVKGRSYSAALWYPSHRAESEINDADWTIRCGRNGKIADGVFPLVLISHDSAGSKHSLHDLAAMLARHGFIVLCISHTGDNYRDADLVFSPALIPSRVYQLKRMLDLFLAMPEWAEHVDVSRLALVGIGTGASTVLALSGAPLNGPGYEAYCTQNPTDEIYCSQWARSRMQGADTWLTVPLPKLEPKALVLVAPEYGMLFEPGAARDLKCPVLIFSAGMSFRRGAANQAGLFMSALGERAVETVLPNFTSEDFLAKCPPSFDEPSAACSKVENPARKARNREFLERTTQFLVRTVMGKHSL